MTYLLFLVNTVVGLIAGIWRMVITALYNIVHLGRIDISLLHRTAESFDPGRTRLCSSFLGQLGLLTIVRSELLCESFTFLCGNFHNMLLYLIEIYSVKKKKCSKTLLHCQQVTLCHVTPFSLQILHQLPEGGGEPVSPSSEGFLRAAAGHNGGEPSNRTEDEGRRRR